MRSPLDAWIASLTGLGGQVAPDPAALSAWQATRLRDMAQWARSYSPFYREHLAGLPPLAENADLPTALFAPLPFITADDLREHGQRMLCVSQGEVDRVVTLTTSGTTGKPKRLFFTGQDLEITLDFFRVGMSTLTGPGDTVLILLPGRRPDGAADLLARALPDIGVRAVLAPEGCPDKDLPEIVRRESVTCLAVLATRLQRLLNSDTAAWAGPGLVTRVLLSGEPVSISLRADASRAGIEIFDHYGLTETCFGGGVECGAHQGYHLREADLYFEIVDPTTGAPVPDGQEGEVVVSTLARPGSPAGYLAGMPLLRYRTGDLAAMLPGPCPCGSPLRRLGPLAGRIERTGNSYRVASPEKGAANRP